MPHALLDPIRRAHARLRDAVVAACEAAGPGALAAVAHEAEEDTIYAIDRVSEEALLAAFADVAAVAPLRLLAEGLPPEGVVLPAGTPPGAVRWRVLVDPIDGTRGLMYGKRSAWILTGAAPERGAATRLRDVVVAVQTEIPTPKQHLSDCAWAVRGEGARAERVNRLTGAATPLPLRPSTARGLAHGFASVARFFPGGRGLLAAVDDALVLAVEGPPPAGRALVFEDQYIATGGQLFELMTGRDRFIADLRPLLAPHLAAEGLPPALCTHPYDLCAALVAEEAGVVLTAPDGGPLDAPLDLTTDVAWVGYASDVLRARVEPHLHAVLARFELQ